MGKDHMLAVPISAIHSCKRLTESVIDREQCIGSDADAIVKQTCCGKNYRCECSLTCMHTSHTHVVNACNIKGQDWGI